MIRNVILFYGEELLAPRPTPKLEDHPLSVVRDCLFAATLHIGGRSSIRHAVVIGAHLSWGKPYHRLLFKYENTESKFRQPFTSLSKVWLSLSRFSRNSRFRDNFSVRTVRNFMKNPRNCLVAGISDRWKIGRKDRNGPHTVSFFLLNERQKLAVYCMKHRHSDCTSRSRFTQFLFLRDCALTWLENLHHVSNWRHKFQFKAICRHDPWPHLSCVGG